MLLAGLPRALVLLARGEDVDAITLQGAARTACVPRTQCAQQPLHIVKEDRWPQHTQCADAVPCLLFAPVRPCLGPSTVEQ